MRKVMGVRVIVIMWVADNYGFRDVMGIIGVSGDLMF